MANTSNCYSFPDVGSEPDLVDGDTSSYSHSTSATKGSYDVCIFDEPIDIKQVKIWPRQDWWLWYRSSNLTVNLYEFAAEGSTYSYNDISLANLLYSVNITTDGNSWTNNHKTFNIPSISDSEIIDTTSCSSNDIAKLPLKNGEAYLVFAVSNYFENYGNSDSVNINFTIHTCEIEVCPINTYRNNITGECTRCGDSSSYAYYYNDNIGSTTPNDCLECPNHRRLKDKDNVWCSPEECQVVYITHDNGLGNEIDGLYYNLGTSDNASITKYLSYSLNTLIDYDTSSDRFEIKNLLNDTDSNISSNIIAYSQSNANEMNQYPFLFSENTDWYEENVIFYDDIPNSKLQIIKITQKRNSSYAAYYYNNLQLAEIKIFPKSDPTTNIAAQNATCFNLPVNPGFYWYNADDKTGVTTYLTDNNEGTTTENNDPNEADFHWCANNNCTMMCILDEPIEVSHVIIYPIQNTWRFYRTSDVLIEFYDSVTILNGWTLNDSNVNNSILENMQFGQIFYSSRQGLTSLNETFNISNVKYVSDENKPLSIECPYKYSYDCQSQLDAICGDTEVWKAIKTGVTNTDNAGISWRCINRTWLTNDLLNYEHSYWPYSKYSSYIYSWKWNMDTSADSILTECKDLYVVHNISKFNCEQDDNVFRCTMTEFRNENGDIIEIYNKLGMYVKFVATQEVNDQDTYHYPINGRVFVNDSDGETNSAVFAELIVPNNCQGNWTIELIFDQTSIGGEQFDLFDTNYIIDSSSSGDGDDSNNDNCVEFDCGTIITSIDTFEIAILNHIPHFQDIYQASCADYIINANETEEEISPGSGGNNNQGLDETAMIILIVVGVVIGLLFIGVGGLYGYRYMQNKKNDGGESSSWTNNENVGEFSGANIAPTTSATATRPTTPPPLPPRPTTHVPKYSANTLPLSAQHAQHSSIQIDSDRE